MTQHKRLGRAVRVAAATVARPPMIARVNPLRAGVEDVIASVGADGAVAHPHRNGRSVVFAGHVNVTSLAAFRAGLIQPQDPTATAAACACGVAPGMRVLDLCSAPGTKTTCLAENMMNDGEIVAVDVSAEKLSRVQDSCARMGITIVKTCLAADLPGSSRARSTSSSPTCPAAIRAYWHAGPRRGGGSRKNTSGNSYATSAFSARWLWSMLGPADASSIAHAASSPTKTSAW